MASQESGRDGFFRGGRVRGVSGLLDTWKTSNFNHQPWCLIMFFHRFCRLLFDIAVSVCCLITERYEQLIHAYMQWFRDKIKKVRMKGDGVKRGKRKVNETLQQRSNSSHCVSPVCAMCLPPPPAHTPASHPSSTPPVYKCSSSQAAAFGQIVCRKFLWTSHSTLMVLLL